MDRYTFLLESSEEMSLIPLHLIKGRSYWRPKISQDTLKFWYRVEIRESISHFFAPVFSDVLFSYLT